MESGPWSQVGGEMRMSALVHVATRDKPPLLRFSVASPAPAIKPITVNPLQEMMISASSKTELPSPQQNTRNHGVNNASHEVLKWLQEYTRLRFARNDAIVTGRKLCDDLGKIVHDFELHKHR